MVYKEVMRKWRDFRHSLPSSFDEYLFKEIPNMNRFELRDKLSGTFTYFNLQPLNPFPLPIFSHKKIKGGSFFLFFLGGGLGLKKGELSLRLTSILHLT